MVTKKSISLFQKAAVNVPAYNDFLKARGVDASKITSPAKFELVPLASKKNYLQQYPLTELLWNENLATPLTFCSTSGSTGAPFYFPRNDELSWQYSWLAQDFLKQNSLAADKPTLVIIALGMGVWIGGIITLQAFETAINRINYPASILPVGYNKTEIFKALRQLSPNYSQTILIGYPPFIKQLVDESAREGINLTMLNLRFIFAAESFTETFRDYICKKTGANPLLDTMNIYGTADIGAMAYETPLSILIRRLATKSKPLFRDIFGQISKTPTLAQYNPRYIDFEEIEGEIILTGDSAMPLIRYAIGDNGGKIEYNKMVNIFKKNGIDLLKESKKAGIDLNKLPFVYVYERTDFSVTLHGINIYPEFIKEGLLHPDLSPYLTEKFTMITKYNKQHNQYLEINLEMQTDVTPSKELKSFTSKIIRQKLIEKSSEFAEVSKSPSSKNLIKLVFWHQDHPRYFTPGIKQKWVQTE